MKKTLPSHALEMSLLIAVITLIGGALRLFFVLRADFPLNDGGMFSWMTRELIETRFRLPEFTAYNHSQIPFAYPPLPFYLAGLLQQAFQIDLLSFYLYFPAIVSALTIPAFFVLSLALLQREPPAIHATLIFAIIPPGYEWLIMGGGVVRAPAFLFSLLALAFSVRALRSRTKAALFWGAVFGGLTLLSHLEIFLMTCVWIAASAWFISRDRWGASVVLAIGLASAALSAPWWVTILTRHGMDPFRQAFSAGDFSLLTGIADLLLRNLSGEFLITPILVFAILGFARKILHQDWILPVWALAAALVNPRSLERSLSIPLSLLAGTALDEIILPGLHSLRERLPLRSSLFPNLFSAALIGYLLFRSALTAMLYIASTTRTLDSLPPADRSAMTWVSEHTPPESRFLLLTPPMIWENNHTAEWFPALADRFSASTVQGSEWLPGGYPLRSRIYRLINECALETSPDCLQRALSESGQGFDYIYLSGKMQDRHSGVRFPLPMETALRESPSYSLLYEKDGVLVFSAAESSPR